MSLPCFRGKRWLWFSLCVSVFVSVCMDPCFYFSSLFVDKSRERHMFLKSLSISLSVRALIPGYHQRFTLALRHLGQGPVWHFNFPLSDEVMNVPSKSCVSVLSMERLIFQWLARGRQFHSMDHYLCI